MSLKSTIEKAAEVAGSQNELARLLGVMPQHISNYKSGKKVCGLERRIQIAEIAGEDPRRAIVDYLADQLDESDEFKAEIKQRVIGIYESLDPETKKPLQAQGSQGVSWRKRKYSNYLRARLAGFFYAYFKLECVGFLTRYTARFAADSEISYF